MKQSFLILSALDLSGTKATRANVNGGIRAVYNCLNPTNVGLPGSVGLAVGVRHVVSESNALTADTALSHFDTSKNPALASVILYKFICVHNSAGIIIAHNEKKSKGFLQFF